LGARRVVFVKFVELGWLHLLQSLFAVHFLQAFNVFLGLLLVRLDSNIQIPVEVDVRKAGRACLESTDQIHRPRVGCTLVELCYHQVVEVICACFVLALGSENPFHKLLIAECVCWKSVNSILMVLTCRIDISAYSDYVCLCIVCAQIISSE